MRITKLTLAAVLVSCGITLAVLHHFRAAKEGQYWWLREQNDRMRYEAYQRIRTARETAAAAREAASVHTSEPARTSSTVPPSRQQPSTGSQYGYHDAGLSSPAAAMQTFVWACDQGDTDMVVRMLHMEPAERAQAEAFLAAMPAESRAKWGSVDQLAAHLLIISSMGHSFPASDVLAAAPIEMLSEDQASCGVVQKVTFRRRGAEWKCELTAERLISLHREIASPAGTAQ